MPETPIHKSAEASVDRPIEIIHYPASDVIINNDADRAAYGRRLAELFKDGYPPDWEPISIGGVDMARGLVDGAEFLAKHKIRSGAEMYGRQKEVRLAFARTEEERRGILRTAQRLNGILSEIGLSPAVEQLTASEEAQEIANRWGFKSFGFVEPVIGVVYKPSGDKSLVYEYIHDAQTLADESIKSKYGITDEKGMEMIDSLHIFFAQHGIEATDLDSRQLLVDNDGDLYLTDIELYERLPVRA